MKLERTFPPNYARIARVFPYASRRGVIFTYGDTIYAPTDSPVIPPPIMAHEEVHSKRQGDNPEEWWDKYLTHKNFRLEEELFAHIREYEFYVNASRNQKRIALKQIANKLASPVYGKMITKEKAKALISKGVRSEEI